MECAEMSINVTAIGRGMDVHKKALFVEHSDVDSGIELSMSQSNATASTSGLSSSAKFSSTSFKRSIDLETISENIEPNENLQETPTTRSIRYLNAFHINTPQNARNQIETTPTKANIFYNPYDSSSRNSGKKNRSQNNIRWSHNRSSPRIRSASGRKSLSRQTTFESFDENFENIFNDDGENPCDQSIGVSPIKPFNNSTMVTKQMEKVPELQRHPSGIESSTPKNLFRRTHTQTIVKPKINHADDVIRNAVRKTQSFSPAKRFPLSRRNFQNSFEPEDEECFETENLDDNPARKLLNFTPQKFNQLFNQATTQPMAVTTTKTSITNDNVMESGTIKYLPPKRQHAYKSSRLVREFSRKKSIKHIGSASNKAVRNLNDSDLSMSFGEDNAMNISQTEVSSAGTPNCKLETNSKDTPVQNNCVKKNICDGANRTPIKRIEKSISHNYIQTKSSPEKEILNIIYGHLPCTPPKKYTRRHLKRTVSTRDDSPQPTAPSAKRKLYSRSDCHRPSYINGFEQLDILTHLHERKVVDAIGMILEYLPGESLLAAHSVCKSWRKLIDENPKNLTRCREFANQMQMHKENINIDGAKMVINNNSNNKNRNIQPLHQHNPNCDTVEKPVPVSPTTRRFKEHQSIISKLKPNQGALHCPLCNGISIVYPETKNDAKPQRKSPRRHGHNKSSLSVKGNTTKTKMNNGLTKSVVSEYAKCSKVSCRFEFCTNCKGYRHIDEKCTIRPLGSSPKSDEDSPYKHEEIITKRPLRRLGRLVF
ncbi:uncharacterized protein LOC116345331 [Contarinia nasturtii]|uniref:uncharacterized protein LOC116345331 n=1 Tax=Contarinia nasturtii TaxID=265458 RepID=UPI0012D38999|nr:uncharacterized protein LOC116345331 [Contarinia nasturtii]